MLRRSSRKRSHWKLFLLVCVCVTCGLFLFQMGFIKGKDCSKNGQPPCQEERREKEQQNERPHSFSRTSKARLKMDEVFHENSRGKLVQDFPLGDKPSVQLQDQAKEAFQKSPRHVYVQIREADSPILGDFTCGGTVVPKCCAFYVGSPTEGKKICDAFSDFCKGFVMTTLSTSVNQIQYMIYLKKSLKGMVMNYVTDLYVKSNFVNEMKWNGPTADQFQSSDVEYKPLESKIDPLKYNRIN